MCKCSPPKVAILLETKKEGPNQGRWFYKCAAKSSSDQCKFFEWQDQSSSQSQSQSASTSRFPSSSGNRLGSSTPSQPAHSKPKQAPITPSQPSSSRKRTESEMSDDDEERAMLEAMNASTDDEIEIIGGADDPFQTPTKKKQKFDSFSTPGSKNVAASSGTSGSGNSEYRKVMADAESPFHKLQNTLFGNGGGGTPASSSAAGSSADPVQGFENALGQLAPQWEAIKKELAKKDRLIEAGKKRAVVLQERMVKAESERDAHKKDNEQLQQKVHLLDLEITELRTRIARDE
ncbi:hypothetical protein RQP46_009727 [Phenoliferia psychrophenolica]